MKKTGHHAVDPPEKNQHAPNWDKALRNALDQWNRGDPENVQITFEASISPNPGGIKEYRVSISG